MPKGILIQIPTGSNKSYFISQLSQDDKKHWLDGDKILKKIGIKNKLQYWYDEYYDEEKDNTYKINKINKILSHITRKGFNIFFSGNPLKTKTDVIIIPEMNERWDNITKRRKTGVWTPNEGLFTLEQQSYTKAMHSTPIVINGNIPNIKTLKSFYDHINFQYKINKQYY